MSDWLQEIKQRWGFAWPPQHGNEEAWRTDLRRLVAEVERLRQEIKDFCNADL